MNAHAHERFEEPARPVVVSMPGLGKPKGHKLQDMVALYGEVEKMLNRTIPDGAELKLHGVLSDLTDAITDAPIECARDIATKFRFLAELIDSDDDGGMMYSEPMVAQRAVSDLLAFRRTNDGGDCAPFYQNFEVS